MQKSALLRSAREALVWPVSVNNESKKRERLEGNVDLEALKQELAASLEGEVRFDRASIGMYATDSSNFREIPLGVVVPKTTDDVVKAHRICSHYRAPILNRGGGTSLSGETVNFAVVIDHSKYLTRVGEPDVERRLVTVEPGAINEQVNKHTGKQNLVFGPDPSSHAYCTIGGNIGNNSCGIHSVQAQIYGPGPRTSDNVHSMEIVTYEGHRIRVGVNEESELDRIIEAGGTQGGDLRTVTPAAGPLRAPDPGALSAGEQSTAAGFRLQSGRAAAGTRLQRGAGAGRHGGDMRDGAGNYADADAGTVEAANRGGSVRRTAGGGDTSRGNSEMEAHRAGGNGPQALPGRAAGGYG